MTDIETAGAEETLRLVRAAGGEGFTAELNVRNEADFEAMKQRLEAEWNGVDVIINNAGVATGGTVVESPLDDWQWVLDINLLGVVRGCKHLVPLLAENNGGHVVNIASFAAIASAPAMASYNVAKAGVVSLSETLRAEVYDDNIRVTVACPEFFKTNLMETFRSPDEKQAAMVSRIIERAPVTAEDVAEQIYAAVMENRFLVITHQRSRMQWRMKRLSPEFFFHQVRKATRGFLKPKENTS